MVVRAFSLDGKKPNSTSSWSSLILLAGMQLILSQPWDRHAAARLAMTNDVVIAKAINAKRHPERSEGPLCRRPWDRHAAARLAMTFVTVSLRGEAEAISMRCRQATIN